LLLLRYGNQLQQVVYLKLLLLQRQSLAISQILKAVDVEHPIVILSHEKA
jgi:hypothetical protein